MRTGILTLFFLLSSLTAFSQIIRIPDDQPTIQAGIDASENGDTVLVMPGTYFENLNLKGKNILLGSLFITTGDLSHVGTTIINGSMPAHPDTASCILIIRGEDSTCVIAGFTITGGQGTRWEDEHGPGRWYTEGGGILIQNAAPTIRNNIITGNEAVRKGTRTVSAGGGAIRCGDGNPHILNNMIISNKGLYGGGIVLNYSGAVIRNNVIARNTGGQDYGGGGIWLNGSGVKPRLIENNTITQNTSTTYGGGVEASFGSSGTYVNNIIYGNSAPTKPQVNGTPRMTYSDIQGGYTGTGNFDDNPRFSGATYALPDDSHCIDAGNPDAGYNDPEDPQHQGLARNPAKGTLRNDMGAYGGQGSQELPVADASGTHPVAALIYPVNIYPNPADDQVIVAFPELNELFNQLIITDPLGRIVWMQAVAAGDREIRISLDRGRFISGLYILKMSGPTSSFTRRLIINHY